MAGFEMQVNVGPQVLADGAKATMRGSRDGSGVVLWGGAKYREVVGRGGCFLAAVPASAGVAPGTALGTAAAFALYNPAGSGKNLVILRASLGYVSGTLGAGLVQWVGNFNANAAAVSGTAIVAVNALVGNQNQAVGKPFYTATLPAAPTSLRPFCSLGASLASTAVQPWQVIDDVDGEIQVAPGGCVSLEGIAAGGSSPLVSFGICWEEVPA